MLVLDQIDNGSKWHIALYASHFTTTQLKKKGNEKKNKTNSQNFYFQSHFIWREIFHLHFPSAFHHLLVWKDILISTESLNLLTKLSTKKRERKRGKKIFRNCLKLNFMSSSHFLFTRGLNGGWNYVTQKRLLQRKE
jgi:hypothetical protein